MNICTSDILPSGLKHQAACIIFLGEPYRMVHRLMDNFSTEMGPKHREVFHDPWQIFHILAYSKEKGTLIYNNLTKSFIAGLLHLIQDKDYDGLEEIEFFMHEISEGKHSRIEDLDRSCKGDIDQEVVYKEIESLILNLGFGIRSNTERVEFSTYPNEYFDLFIECSNCLGYSHEIEKRLERFERRNSKNLPSLYSLMITENLV